MHNIYNHANPFIYKLFHICDDVHILDLFLLYRKYTVIRDAVFVCGEYFIFTVYE
jgi:hypothetical protein